jgi:hypothetical protein
MVFLRSEEHLARWLEANSWKRGASFEPARLNVLACRWWSTRLQPDWRPRSAAESQAMLDEVGLRGEFWRLT